MSDRAKRALGPGADGNLDSPGPDAVVPAKQQDSPEPAADKPTSEKE